MLGVAGNRGTTRLDATGNVRDPVYLPEHWLHSTDFILRSLHGPMLRPLGGQSKGDFSLG